jgi:hypothetical protein
MGKPRDPPSGQPLSSLKTLPFSFYSPFNPTRCGQTRGGGRGNCLLQVSLCPPFKALSISSYYPFNSTRCGQTKGGGRGSCLLQVSLFPPLKIYLFLSIVPLSLPNMGKPRDRPSGQPLSSLKTLSFSIYYPFNPTRWANQGRKPGKINYLISVSLAVTREQKYYIFRSVTNASIRSTSVLS